MEKTLSHHLLPNNQTNLLSWDAILEIMDYFFTDDVEYNENFAVASKENCQPIHLQKQITAPRQMVTSYVLRNTNICNNTAIAERMHRMYNDLGVVDFAQQKLDTNHCLHISLYISFFPFASSHDIHCDNTDVYHWQQKGYSQWDVYDNGKKTYVLGPGDAIFIPMGMYHRVTPLTARAGVSLCFFPDDAPSDEMPLDYFKRKGLTFPYDKPPFNDEVAEGMTHWYN